MLLFDAYTCANVAKKICSLKSHGSGHTNAFFLYEDFCRGRTRDVHCAHMKEKLKKYILSTSKEKIVSDVVRRGRYNHHSSE